MTSRWLWNSHQRNMFLRAKASRDMLKFRVLEMSFPGVSRGIFHYGGHVVSSEYVIGTSSYKICKRFDFY